jgi:membrane protein YqaA with SNARE-associated domain
MAAIGSVIGGYVTYRLARKGGKETLERKFPAQTLERVYRIFGHWGFGAIAIAALLPPPVPMVPSLFAAGAMQYSVGKFLVALTVGRLSDIPSWRSWRPTMDGKCSRSRRNLDIRSSSPSSN